jgi:hypothetical protein
MVVFLSFYFLVCWELGNESDDDYETAYDEGSDGFEAWSSGKIDPACPVRIEECGDAEE